MTDVIEEVELNSGNNDLKMDSYFEHLLTTLKGKPQTVWLENFSGVDTDILAKNRTILFYQVKARYIEELMEHNIDEVPEPTFWARKGNGAHKRLALDIYWNWKGLLKKNQMFFQRRHLQILPGM